jgi:Pentapeptide repeats (8 copies)
MTHWLDGVARVLASQSTDLKHLASIADVDPTHIFRFADLSKCDLRGQDLRGLDFTGAILEGAILDEKTKIDPEFDPRSQEKSYYRIFANRILISIINSSAYESGYSYAIWYAKAAYERSAFLLRHNSQFQTFVRSICSSEKYRSYYLCDERSSYYVKHILASNWVPVLIDSSFDEIDADSRFSLSVFSYILFVISNENLTDEGGAFEIMLSRRDSFSKNLMAQSYMSLF